MGLTMSAANANLLEIVWITLLAISPARALFNDSFLTASTSECPMCPGDTLQLNCTVVGRGSTVWRGSTLTGQCPQDSNEMTFPHNAGDRSLVCGVASADGQPLSDATNCYKSQLMIILEPSLNGSSITCVHDSGTISVEIGTFDIIFPELPPPYNVGVTNIDYNSLDFNWMDSIPESCPNIVYITNTSGCGTCPNVTNSKTLSCFGDVFNESRPCILSIQTSTCGQYSRSTNAMIQVASVPVKVNSIVPTYSQQTNQLISVMVEFHDMASVTVSTEGTIEPIPAISYTLNYTDLDIGVVCSFKEIDPQSEVCPGRVCHHVLDVTNTLCLSDISLSVSASTGIGPASIDMRHIGAKNEFVRVTIDLMTNNLNCTFLNSGDQSTKNCDIMYWHCENQSTIRNASAERPFAAVVLVELSLDLSSQDDYQSLCYNVSASNGSFTVIVHGNTTIENGVEKQATGLSFGVIILIVLLIVAFVITVLIISFILIMKCPLNIKNKIPCLPDTQTSYDHQLHDIGCVTPEIIQEAQISDPKEDNNEFQGLEEIESGFQLFEVHPATGLRKYLKEKNIDFTRGIAFYEFINPTEDIDTNTRIILQEKCTKRLFSAPNACEIVFKVTKSTTSNTQTEVDKPDLEKYSVFVQDNGTGSRFLESGSHLLVNIQPKPSNTTQIVDFTEVQADHFTWYDVKEDSQLHAFIKEKGKQYWRGCAFYEFSHESEDISVNKEVLLLDMKTNRLYTGKEAKKMVGMPGLGIRNQLDKTEWKVFVQSKCTGNRHLDGNTQLLYQSTPLPAHSNSDDESTVGDFKEHEETDSVDEYIDVDTTGDLKVLKVPERCSLRHFIDGHEETNGYQRKCAYYEFCHDEEDIKNKSVILMDKAGKLYVGGGTLEKIGAHTSPIGVKKPDLSEYPKVFIQCNGPGYNIYLPAGSSIIYKDPKVDRLDPVDPDDYDRVEVKTTCELRSFVGKEFGTFNRGSAFFQFTCDLEDISKDKEVLLLSKDSKLFTGSAACHKIGAPGKGIRRPPPEFEYTVFIQNTSRGSRCLMKETTLFYKKNPKAK